MKVATNPFRFVKWGLLPAIALWLMPSSATAQKPIELEYVIRLEPAFTESDAKYVQEALLAVDPRSVVSVDAPSQRVKVRTVVPVDVQGLQAGLGGSGLQVVNVHQVLPDDPSARSEAIMASFGFPFYVNAGSPEQDQAAHEAAKSAWIAADPARYADLLQALNGNPDQPQLER